MSHRHVEIAREWIGTPYRHQGSTKGIGCDCLGLVRGIWRQAVGDEPTLLPAYSPDWSEYGDQEPLRKASEKYLEPRELDFKKAGEIVLFRMKRNAVAKHLGVLAPTPGHLRMIHALSGREVCEVTLTPDWQSRAVAQFAFPDRRF